MNTEKEKMDSEKIRVHYNNKYDAVHVDIMSMDTAEDVHQMWDQIKKNFIGLDNRKILANVSESNQKYMSRETRRAFMEYEEYLNTLDKVAFVVSNPIVRMLVKATVTVMDTRKIVKFFKTEEEAITWFNGK